MRSFGMVVGFLLAGALPLAAQQKTDDCKSAVECAKLTQEAIGTSEFEHAHDLAWRAVQLGPRNDTSLMYLLARTQSLSGRPLDALVMLRRIAALGFRSEEIETLEDFRRVRALPGWPDASAELRAPALVTGAPDKTTAPQTANRSAKPANAGATAPAQAADAKSSNSATSAATASAARAAPTISGKPTGSAKAAAPDSATAAKAEATAEVVGAGLHVSVAPLTLAYDRVSARFVVTDEASDTVKVVDERTGNVIDLVGHGWSGAYRPAALAIDAKRGELWVAGVDSTTSDKPRTTLYKLQLVSGRLLEKIALPEDAGATSVIDVAVGHDAVFLLDGSGRRVFSLRQGTTSPRVVATLVSVNNPVSIAADGDSVLYVAHEKGLARVDLTARTRLPTPVPAAADIGALQSINWHDGSLFAIQRTANGRQAARIRLNARGTTAIALDLLGPAASRAAGVYDGVFYYVVPDETRGLILRGMRPR